MANKNIKLKDADGNYLFPKTKAALVEDLSAVATSGSYNDLSDKPAIPTVNNGKLSIQGNGTTASEFTANQSGNTTLNIKGSGATTVTKSAADEITVSSTNTTYSQGTGITISGTTISANIEDSVSSTATNKSLSANQGKVLSDKIAAIEGRGRYLSIWDASTGRPNDLPGGGSSVTEVYTYKSGDYFIVKVAGNKVPSGTSIPVGTTISTFPSTTGESAQINDSIYFNGTSWAVLHTPAGTGDVTGPSSSTNNAIVKFNGTTGKIVQNSGCTIDASNNMSIGGKATVGVDQTASGYSWGTKELTTREYLIDTSTGKINASLLPIWDGTVE